MPEIDRPVAADLFLTVSEFSEVVQDMVLSSTDIGDFLTTLAQQAALTLSGEDGDIMAAVVLLRPRKKTTAGSSSDRARAIDRLQLRYDDGPCLRAAREGVPCLVTDFRTESRFGSYARRISDHGVRSALGVPIPMDGSAQAALDVYSTQPGAFGMEAAEVAGRLAQDASRALRTAVRIAHLSDARTDLKAAMDSRTAIQVAAGIIMGQNRCSHDEAMTILKVASGSRNMKLSEVAAAVLRSIGQSPPTTHFDS